MACLAIGVGDAPPLDYLRGAVNGARAMADWASTPGRDYTAELLTDEQAPVEIGNVADALSRLLAPTPRGLILYFAGHGLSKGVGEDLWLLSRWNTTRRGVSVRDLTVRLERYGLDRLILISDACRSLLPDDARDMVGDPVLDRGGFDDRLPDMDVWNAAAHARVALMIPGPKPEQSRCIFSGLLFEALGGAHQAACDTSGPSPCITNFSLSSFIKTEVPKRAEAYGASLKPQPVTGIAPPHNVYVSPVPADPPTFPPWPDPAEATVGMGMAGAERIEPPPGLSWTTRDTEGDPQDRNAFEVAPPSQLEYRSSTFRRMRAGVGTGVPRDVGDTARTRLKNLSERVFGHRQKHESSRSASATTSAKIGLSEVSLESVRTADAATLTRAEVLISIRN